MLVRNMSNQSPWEEAHISHELFPFRRISVSGWTSMQNKTVTFVRDNTIRCSAQTQLNSWNDGENAGPSHLHDNCRVARLGSAEVE